MMSDVHMWDHTLSPCEIQEFMEHLNFTPGNVLNWSSLDFKIVGRVLLKDKLFTCGIWNNIVDLLCGGDKNTQYFENVLKAFRI